MADRLQLLRDYRNPLLLAIGVCVAVAVRHPLIPIETGDMQVLLSWYAFIVQNGLFAALQHDFSNYNVPYLYLLATVVVVLPSQHEILAIKAISIAFDFVLAFFVYKCVELKYRDAQTISFLPMLAGLATLLAPTVVLNSSAWGQCDSIYTTFLVACLYSLLAGRQAHAFVAFGLAVSFKLQAVFLAPLFLWLLVQDMAVSSDARRVWRRYFLLGLLVPAVYLASLVPALLIGRPFLDLLAIYYHQSQVHNLLTLHAPNLYVWIPSRLYPWWPAGLILATFAALLVAFVIHRSRAKMTAELTVLLAAFSVLLMPYILPKMHQRYFFPADVIAIVLAFYLPRYWYMPVVIGLVSLCCYIPYLTSSNWIWMNLLPMESLALALLVLIAVLSKRLYAGAHHAGAHKDALGHHRKVAP